ncbi:MAG: AtpZ/AtpI family protein [Ignavibacteria bacterium]|nr:AtpZ/AtpI family protein [Ignavibacteria bacterium]
MALKPESDSGIAKSFREAGPYLGLGLQLAVTIVVMLLIGDWLDKKFGHKYLFTLIFAFVGISAGLYNMLKTIAGLEKRNKEKNERK